jgi:hypothetical protein
MGKNRDAIGSGGDGGPRDGEVHGKNVTAAKRTAMAPRWERAKREKDKKKKQQ